MRQSTTTKSSHKKAVEKVRQKRKQKWKKQNQTRVESAKANAIKKKGSGYSHKKNMKYDKRYQKEHKKMPKWERFQLRRQNRQGKNHLKQVGLETD